MTNSKDGIFLSSIRQTRSKWNAIVARLKCLDGMKSDDYIKTSISSSELSKILSDLQHFQYDGIALNTKDISGVLASLATILIPLCDDMLYFEFYLLLQKCLQYTSLDAHEFDKSITLALCFLKNCTSWYKEQALNMLFLVLDHSAANLELYANDILEFSLPYIKASVIHCTSQLAALKVVQTFCLSNTLDRLEREQKEYRLIELAIRELVICVESKVLSPCNSAQSSYLQQVVCQTMSILSSIAKNAKIGKELLRDYVHRLLRNIRKRVQPSEWEAFVCIPKKGHIYDHLIAALQLLCSLTNEFPEVVDENLKLFLPEVRGKSFAIYGNEFSLLSLIVYHPDSNVRTESALAIHAVLHAIRYPVSYQASKANSRSNIRTKSAGISGVIRTAHMALQDAATTADHGPLISALLNVFAKLVGSAPDDLLKSCLPHHSVARYFFRSHHALRSREGSERAAGVACLSSILGVENFRPFIKSWVNAESLIDRNSLMNRPDDKSLLTMNNTSILVDLLTVANRPKPKKSTTLNTTQAVLLLSKVAYSAPNSFMSRWDYFLRLYFASFTLPDDSIRLGCVKIVESFLRGRLLIRNEVRTTTLIDEIMLRDFFLTNLPKSFSDPSHHVRNEVCSCYALLCPASWELLAKQSNEFAFLLDSIHNTCLDTSSVVRTSSFRVIGSMIKAAYFEENFCRIGFEINLMLDAMTDQVTNVRFRSCWALGLVFTRQDCTDVTTNCSTDESTKLPCSLLGQALTSSMVLVEDNEKVAVCAVRCIGHILRLYCHAMILEDNDSIDLISRAIKLLCLKAVEKVSTPKLQWTVCVALERVLTIDVLGNTHLDCLHNCVETLLQAFCVSKNNKIQCNAVIALGSGSSIHCYASKHFEVLQILIKFAATASISTNLTSLKSKQVLFEATISIFRLSALVLDDNAKKFDDFFTKFDIEWKEFLNCTSFIQVLMNNAADDTSLRGNRHAISDCIPLLVAYLKSKGFLPSDMLKVECNSNKTKFKDI